MPKASQALRECAWCGSEFQPRRAIQIDCSRLCNRRRNEAKRAAKRRSGEEPQRCYKCDCALTGRLPGFRVCDGCRADPRKHRHKAEAIRRLRSYGLTQDQYDALWLSQNKRCAVCGTAEPTSKGWCIDHCHDTGRVRGILCAPCNMALGQFADDPQRMRAAADYIEQH